MTNKKKVLPDSEIEKLKILSLYWKDMRSKKDNSSLESEAIEVSRMLGIRLLDLVEHYFELLDKENKK